MLLENSLYKTPQEKDAFISDKERVMSALLLNVFGFIGIYKLSHKRGLIAKYPAQELKLRVNSISDENYDVSLVVKLAFDEKLIDQVTADKITRLLSAIKEKKITNGSDIDENLIRGILEHIKFDTHRPDPLIAHVMKEFQQSAISLGELAEKLYTIAKMPKFKTLTHEFRHMVMTGSYTDIFKVMPKMSPTALATTGAASALSAPLVTIVDPKINVVNIPDGATAGGPDPAKKAPPAPAIQDDHFFMSLFTTTNLDELLKTSGMTKDNFKIEKFTEFAKDFERINSVDETTILKFTKAFKKLSDQLSDEVTSVVSSIFCSRLVSKLSAVFKLEELDDVFVDNLVIDGTSIASSPLYVSMVMKDLRNTFWQELRQVDDPNFFNKFQKHEEKIQSIFTFFKNLFKDNPRSQLTMSFEKFFFDDFQIHRGYDNVLMYVIERNPPNLDEFEVVKILKATFGQYYVSFKKGKPNSEITINTLKIDFPEIQKLIDFSMVVMKKSLKLVKIEDSNDSMVKDIVDFVLSAPDALAIAKIVKKYENFDSDPNSVESNADQIVDQVYGKKNNWGNVNKYLFISKNSLGSTQVSAVDATLMRSIEKLFEKNMNEDVVPFYFTAMLHAPNMKHHKMIFDWVLRNEEFVFSRERRSDEFFTQTVKFLKEQFADFLGDSALPLIFKRMREGKIVDDSNDWFSMLYEFIFRIEVKSGWDGKDFYFPDKPDLFEVSVSGTSKNLKSSKFVREKVVNGHPLIIEWLKNELTNGGKFIDDVNEMNSNILFIDDSYVDDKMLESLKEFYSKKENQEKVKPISFFKHSKKITDTIVQIYNEWVKDPNFVKTNISNLLMSFEEFDVNHVFKNFAAPEDFADELMAQNQVDLRMTGSGQDILRSLISVEASGKFEKIDNHGLAILFGAIERLDQKATKNPVSKSYVAEYIATLQRMIHNLSEVSPARADEVFAKLPTYSKNVIANHESKVKFLKSSLASILSDNSPIKPAMSIDENKLEFILERNSVSVPKGVTKANSYTELKAKTDDNLKKEGIKDLAVKEIVEDPEYFLRKSAEFDVFNNGRHQEIAIKFLREFDVDLAIQRAGHEKFLKDNPNSPVIAQAFHGCGSVAAAFILRYGYAVFKSGNSAVSVAGKMLSPRLQRIKRKKV